MDLDDIRREALHDWLNERPPHERPDPSEYEDDLMMGDVPPETIAEAALTPWPPRRIEQTQSGPAQRELPGPGPGE